MFAEFGYGILVVSFLVAIYGVIAAIYGAQNKSATLVESARRAMLLTFPLITLSAVTLIYLLVNDHYEVAFVYEVTSRSMPTSERNHRLVGWTGRLPRILVVPHVRLCIGSHPAQMGSRH